MATRRQRERKARQRAWHGKRTPVSRRVISQAWVDERALEWGGDNLIYVSKVLGEFPPDEEPSIVERDGVSYYWQTSGHNMRAVGGQVIPSGVLTRPVEIERCNPAPDLHSMPHEGCILR